jgi:hypothetical protein
LLAVSQFIVATVQSAQMLPSDFEKQIQNRGKGDKSIAPHTVLRNIKEFLAY